MLNTQPWFLLSLSYCFLKHVYAASPGAAANLGKATSREAISAFHALA